MERQKKHTEGASSGTPSESDEAGLSFEAEPAGLEADPSYGSDDVKPGRDSPRAAFTPGRDTQGRSIWRLGAIRIVAALAVAAAIALVFGWLF